MNIASDIGDAPLGSSSRNNIVYGPVESRRLGVSLGINIFSLQHRVCNFDCVYCHLGSMTTPQSRYLEKGIVIQEIGNWLKQSSSSEICVNSITLAGNGEPTLHPNFKEIVDFICNERDKLSPNTTFSLFTNGTSFDKASVRKAIAKADKIFVKIDASDQASFERLGGKGSFPKIIRCISDASKDLPVILSTAVIKSPQKYSNYEQLMSQSFVDVLSQIEAEALTLYSINKPTPDNDIEQASKKDMQVLLRYLKESMAVPVHAFF